MKYEYTSDDFNAQDIWGTPDYQEQFAKIVQRIHSRNNDRFIECPTLITEAARRRNKN